MPAAPTLDDLRRHAIARSLFRPTTLPKAVARLGFVQADPIRAPARAQDLILRHRVRDYRAGDLERRFVRLGLEEDYFVNHGFLPHAVHALMHPRQAHAAWTPERWQQAQAVLEFVRARGVVHPRDVDAAFDHGKTRNWFGGSSNASTQLLDGMQYRGLLRIAGREGGVRVYAERPAHAPQADPDAALDALVDVAVQLYAPLPLRSLSGLLSMLTGHGVPQWRDGRAAALARARRRLPQAQAGGVTWLWPAGENPASARHRPEAAVRLLAPFDPVVWDRLRFELLWGWRYRFEAYTPAPRRVRGYYALPLLWHDQVIGWANVSLRAGELQADIGYVAGHPPPQRTYGMALAAELDAMCKFLGSR